MVHGIRLFIQRLMEKDGIKHPKDGPETSKPSGKKPKPKAKWSERLKAMLKPKPSGASLDEKPDAVDHSSLSGASGAICLPLKLSSSWLQLLKASAVAGMRCKMVIASSTANK